MRWCLECRCFGLASVTTFSKPSNTILHSKGEISPPCGVPVLGYVRNFVDGVVFHLLSKIGAFRIRLIIRLSQIITFSSIALCSIESKHLLISASRIHRPLLGLSKSVRRRAIAC